MVYTIPNSDKNNVKIEQTVALSDAKAQFITSFDSEIGADEKLGNIEYYLETGGIHVEGIAYHVRKGLLLVANALKFIFLSKRLLINL